MTLFDLFLSPCDIWWERLVFFPQECHVIWIGFLSQTIDKETDRNEFETRELKEVDATKENKFQKKMFPLTFFL